METVGYLAPETPEAVEEAYADCEPIARELTREIVLATGIDSASYHDMMTTEVIEAAQAVYFSSVLRIHTGSREEFSEWIASSPYTEEAVHREGSPNVDQIAWHVSRATDQIVAATYHQQREAALSSLRRIVWGRLYAEMVHGVATDE